MARTAKAKSKIGIAADTARKALADAKERNAKNSTDTTKKAVEHAEGIAKAAVKAENRERFVNVGGGRIGKAIALLETLRQVANRRSYEYTQADIDKAMTAIDAKVADIKSVFVAALATPVAAEKKTTEKKAFEF
jgi:hypothetical protein